MEYFKHGDKVKFLSGKCHDRLQDEYEWNTEDYQETEIRITKDYTNTGQLIIGLEDFNINYPEDVITENDDSITFLLFNFAFHLLKEGKEFEVEKNQINFNNQLLDLAVDESENNEIKTIKGSSNHESKDTHLMELIKILKSLSVKKIMFEDGNELEIK